GDPTHEYEIYAANPAPSIQLDLTNLFQTWGNVPISILMNSTTLGEAFTIKVCTGPGGTGTCNTGATGTSNGFYVVDRVRINAPDGDAYATPPHLDPHPNVLLGGISPPIPEPGSIVLLGTGLSAIGGFIRRRRK